MSSAVQNVLSVIQHNKFVQEQAKRLNQRAGKEVFPVMGFEEFKVWLGARLSGATSCSTINDVESLRLPLLSLESSEVVIRDNPDMIELLGVKYPVGYGVGVPKVTIRGDISFSNFWLDLPDEGVKLPGGRLVHLVVMQDGHYSPVAEGVDVPVLKQAIKNRLNQDKWTRAFWPAIAVPRAVDETTVLPEIATTVYGKCAVTGENLMGFGTVTLNLNRWFDHDPFFKPVWFRTREEAEVALQKSKTYLWMVVLKVRTEKEIKQIKIEAEALQRTLRSLYSKVSRTHGLYNDLYNRAYYYFHSGETVSSLRIWIADTKSMIAEAEAVIEQQSRNAGIAPGFHSDIQAVATMPQTDSFASRRQKSDQLLFTEMSSRWFKCDSGHTVRVDKSDWSRYTQGEALSLSCVTCNAQGTAQR